MPTARSGHGATAIDGKLVVIGGEVDTRNPPNRVFDEVELYDPETDRWVSLPPMPVPRHGMGAVTAAGAVYVPGGAFRAGFGASTHNDLLLLHW
jgi:N-acetylneuraminic acid mutarotase